VTEYLIRDEPGAEATIDVASDLVRVVRGEPDEEELAALVAGILAVAAASAPAEPEPDAAAPWADHGRRLLGSTARPGASTWRWSLHP
jgi:hypothetical protein